MIDLAQVEESGWSRIPNVSTRQALLDVALMLGTPVVSSNGELVKELRVVPSFRARTGTLSKRYGRGEFPLHTDTAFWPEPARYLVMKARGDTRRCTTVLSFAELFEKCGCRWRALADSAIWLVRTTSESFYSLMTMKGLGWRYDPQCMSPANRSAQELQEMLCRVMKSETGVQLQWCPDEAIVIANWRVLHGRGPAPECEQERIIERIYVR